MNEAARDAARWKWLLLALVAIDVAVSFRAAYMDPDAMLYVVVGEGIWRHGLWPYLYAFDHKPVLLYVLYGLLSFFPRNMHEFQIVAVLSSLLMGFALKRSSFAGAHPFWLCFVAAHVATIGSIGFGADSEMVFVPLQMASLYCVLQVPRSPYALGASAIVAALAVNTNYVAIFCLLPTIAWCLYATSDSIRLFLARSSVFGVVFLASCGLILFLAHLAGVDLERYFDLQYRFLTSYAEQRRWPSIDLVLRLMLMLAMLPLAFRRSGTVVDRALGVMIGVATLSLVLNGKFFPHYLYTVAAPAALLVMRSATATSLRTRYIFGALCLMTSIAVNVSTRGYYPRDRFIAPYDRLAGVVGGEQVLAIITSIAPQYYAHVVPFQPFIMSDVAPVPLRPVEDAYYSGQLYRRPKFVLTGPGFCDGAGRGSRACAVLHGSYRLRLAFAGEGASFRHDRQQVGYALYQRVAAGAPDGAGPSASGGLNSFPPAPM